MTFGDCIAIGALAVIAFGGYIAKRAIKAVAEGEIHPAIPNLPLLGGISLAVTGVIALLVVIL